MTPMSKSPHLQTEAVPLALDEVRTELPKWRQAGWTILTSTPMDGKIVYTMEKKGTLP